jgi:hypothetical protein
VIRRQRGGRAKNNPACPMFEEGTLTNNSRTSQMTPLADFYLAAADQALNFFEFCREPDRRGFVTSIIVAVAP